MGELVDLIIGTYGVRYQLSREGVVQLINMIQKMALAKDVDGHLVFEDFPIYQTLSMASFSADPVDADIGLPVTDGTATGTLRGFDVDALEVYVETDDDWTAGGAFSVTGGTGAGTLASSGHQENYLGPYDFPETARKVLGVTPYTDADLFRDPQWSQGSRLDSANDPDYFEGPSVADGRRLHLAARQNKLNRTLTLIYEPDRSGSYRWRYYRSAPDILTEDDSDNLLIPEEYHHSLIVQGVQALAHNALYGELAPEKVLEPFLKPYWQAMEDAYDPNGAASSQTSDGQP
jgi:hypothetical protein